jgi:hypothetical protein
MYREYRPIHPVARGGGGLFDDAQMPRHDTLDMAVARDERIEGAADFKRSDGRFGVHLTDGRAQAEKSGNGIGFQDETVCPA